MLTSIRLQNFKSFGEEQTVPLRPITVLVGPNNSGKSAFMSIGDFVRRSLTEESFDAVLGASGGAEFLFHRPAFGDGRMCIAWTVDDLRYEVEIERRGVKAVETDEQLVYGSDRSSGVEEQLTGRLNRDGWYISRGSNQSGIVYEIPTGRPLGGLQLMLRQQQYADAVRAISLPLATSRLVKLSLAALQSDAKVVPRPQLGSTGAGLAAVLALWRGADPERAQRLDEFLHACLPEVKHALVKPGPEDGTQRLWIQQSDGEMFDAAHVSDGVLFFVALAMHAIEAQPGSVIFVEEPEQSIHPRRLGEVVELFRRIVDQYRCQFVISTHSPVVLNQLRDEPESVVLFRRGEQGTRVRTLAEITELVDALRKADPGDLLASGFFNDAF